MILAQRRFDGSRDWIFRCIFLLGMLDYACILFLCFSFVTAPGGLEGLYGIVRKSF